MNRADIDSGNKEGVTPTSGPSRSGSALVRLVGAVLAEQHDDWIEGRRYLGLDVLARSRTRLLNDADPTGTAQPAQPVWSAPAEAISAWAPVA